MIPLRVQLKGFLCYKDEQEVSFDGASLWMLSGLNGSGKSAVFDAVTYSLFGHHRGGSLQAEELINKNSSEMFVEFEFLQDQQAYCIKRTLRRKKGGGASGSQRISQRVHGNGDGLGDWATVEGTDASKGFKEWIEQNIGLNYDTFTSSVLLLQGKAEKLLDSTAKGRFEVLAGIVDLDRFQRLHARTDERRRSQTARVESLHNRLEGLPEVQPLELIEAEGAIGAAEDGRQQAQQEVERLQELEFQARQCRDVQNRLTDLQRRRREMQGLIDEAGKIEKDLARLQELRQVVPRLKAAMQDRQRIEACERELGELAKRRGLVEQELGKHDDSLAKTRHKRQTLEQAQADDQKKRDQVVQELRALAEQLTRLKEYELAEQGLVKLEGDLSRLPANPAADVQQARDTCDSLQALARVRRDLERFATLRQQLAEARKAGKEALTARQQVEARGKQLKVDLERVKAQLDEAERARQGIDDQTSQAKARLEDARRLLNELHGLEGAKVCRACGQSLTPGHIEAEDQRRRREIEDADKRCKEALTRQKATQTQERHLREQLQTLDKQVTEAREEFLQQKNEAARAQKEEERLHGELTGLHDQLPAPQRTQVSPEAPLDWTATTYPSADDLAQLRNQAGGLPVAQRRLGEAEEILSKWSRFKGQETTLRQNLARLQADLPKDRAGIRVKHASLGAEEKALQNGLTARHQALRDNQTEQEQIGKQREGAQKGLAETKAKLESKQEDGRSARQALGRVVKELPPAWQPVSETAGLTEVSEWTHELDELTDRKTEQRAEQLQGARVTVGSLARELSLVEEQVQKFPEEARQDPILVQGQLQQARLAHKTRDEELTKSRQHQHLLETRHKEREEVVHQLLEADGRLKHLELLAKLLGRDRLQLHLVRQAERQVVDHANSVLDRLSSGELFLKLSGEAGGDGNAAKALELEAHNRSTGEKPINVAFLSGSQKFRVAVSLALGIGQYASHQHRPIESVIIDEGFGCLDRNARQVMIQELQNLRSQMRCILLVSHQEEFADAFAHGYHFEMQGGTTVAKRFQR